MKRKLEDIAEKEYDLAIVGGGIFGVCAAWDAVLRGLKVVLLERDDFGGGASANCFKMVHGGIRYIQHGDLIRLRSSCAERSAFLRVAPHLVEPLPILIPTYGHGMKGKEVLAAGMYAYDLMTADRNRGIRDPARRISWSRLISRSRLLAQFPDIDHQGLTGGAMFSDGQMYSPPRLVLAFLRSAVNTGLDALNYAEVLKFSGDERRVTGLLAKDRLDGTPFEIRAGCVINAAGPWAEPLLHRSLGLDLQPAGVYSRDACFVIRKQIVKDFALAVQGRTSDPDALISRPGRHLFIVPWRDVNLVGVWHVVYKDDPDRYRVTERELQAYIDEINWACPAAALSLNDVSLWNAGLVPFGDNEPGAENLSYGKRSRLIDHKKAHGVDGLISLIGIRYTMGRYDARQAVDMAAVRLGKSGPAPRTDWLPIYGGDFASFSGLQAEVARHLGEEAGAGVATAVAHNYGASYQELLPYRNSWPGVFPGSRVLRAEVAHAVQEEMAVKLMDVVARRTDLGTAGHPGAEVLQQCAVIMAELLGWNETRRQEEVRQTEEQLAYQSAQA